MKRFIYLTSAALTGIFATACHNEGSIPSTAVALKYKVWGNCEKCQARIEKAGKLEGVSQIRWNDANGELQLRIDTNITKGDAVLKAIAEAGYDNEHYTANAEAYARLPECCQYQRK